MDNYKNKMGKFSAIFSFFTLILPIITLLVALYIKKDYVLLFMIYYLFSIPFIVLQFVSFILLLIGYTKNKNVLFISSAYLNLVSLVMSALALFQNLDEVFLMITFTNIFLNVINFIFNFIAYKIGRRKERRTFDEL